MQRDSWQLASNSSVSPSDLPIPEWKASPTKDRHPTGVVFRSLRIDLVVCERGGLEGHA